VLGTKLVSGQINQRELKVITRELGLVLKAGTPGDVVELGCYVGTTSLFLQHLLKNTSKTLHVYDSFQGLPQKSPQDTSPAGEQFKAGELAATKTQLINNFRHAGLPLPVIHKAWFEDLKPTDLPHKICFAFLDGDFYRSILTSLRLVWPKLQPGATVIIDDYQTSALPGVHRAVTEWAQGHAYSLQAEATLAILKPTKQKPS
jgi:O-methyltransferase